MISKIDCVNYIYLKIMGSSSKNYFLTVNIWDQNSPIQRIANVEISLWDLWRIVEFVDIIQHLTLWHIYDFEN